MRAKEQELLRYLKKHCLGQQNALGGEKLMKVFRISGTELRKLIHDLRVDGTPICSDRTGYFYPFQQRGGVYHNPSAPTDGARAADGILGHDPGYGRLPPAWGR